MKYDEPTLPTRIPALDRLLNLKNDDGEYITFPPAPEETTTILIRGGQGAGKTTLALQILSNQLAEVVSDTEETLTGESEPKKNFGMFLSLERQAEVALRYAREKFNMKGLVSVVDKKAIAGKVLGIDGNEFREKMKECFSRVDPKTTIKGVVKGVINSVTGSIKASPSNPAITIETSMAKIQEGMVAEIEKLEKTRSEVFDNILAEVLSGFIEIKDRKPENTVWLVIDSMNVLERAIFQRTELEKHRAAIQGIANALHQKMQKMRIVIIFTGEYHTCFHDISGASSESFFSDIEILLTQEPVVGTARTDPRNAAAAGYNIELHHREAYQISEGRQTSSIKASTGELKGQVVVETRPFCRVLKSRFSQIQSRRCSYQILPGEGFHFDEIFPGDGYMLLFEDNPKQREDWLDFLLKDCPHEFPALRFELFDRTHQQRVFSTERCFSGHRQHTDLHLASFDTYWIKWFIELNERLIIGKKLAPLREKIMQYFEKHRKKDPQEETRKLFSKAICHLHFKFLKKPAGEWKAKLKILLPKLGLKIDSDEIDRMLSDEKVDRGIKECCDELKSGKGILDPVPRAELRLFGEQRSELLGSLMEKHKYLENDGMLLSVPFNANISYLVLRKDLLDQLVKGLDSLKQKEFIDEIGILLKSERQAIAKFSDACPLKIRRKWENRKDKSILPDGPASNLEEDGEKLLEIKGRLGEGYRPRTWEEIIALCKIYKWEYVAETRSFDTLLCTFLEMLWSCGADIIVNPEYTVMIEGGMLRFYQSIFLFQELLRHAPPNSTLDAKAFVEHAEHRSESGKEDWAFMRQWHSTIVDLLIAKTTDQTTGDTRFLWRPEKMTELEIAPLPESFWQYYRNNRDKQRGYGVSCWGDWHLAMLRGSENKSLAVGLLNNMMASSKIANRALQGAALPAVEKFYDIYGDDLCLALPERGGLKMPSQTFNDLKNKLFPIAKTRSNIFDYRHCMREIHGFVLELAHARGKKTPEQVSEALQEVFRRIKELSERELMLH